MIHVRKYTLFRTNPAPCSLFNTTTIRDGMGNRSDSYQQKLHTTDKIINCLMNIDTNMGNYYLQNLP